MPDEPPPPPPRPQITRTRPLTANAQRGRTPPNLRYKLDASSESGAASSSSPDSPERHDDTAGLVRHDERHDSVNERDEMLQRCVRLHVYGFDGEVSS